MTSTHPSRKFSAAALGALLLGAMAPMNGLAAPLYADSVNGLDPVVYYRFNSGTPTWSVTNSATGPNVAAGNAGVRFNTMFNGDAGPRPPSYPGFESDNYAVNFNSGDSTANFVYIDGTSLTNLHTQVSGADAVTVSMWFNPASLPTSGQSMTLFRFFIENTAGVAPGFDVSLTNTAGVSQIALGGRSQASDTTQIGLWNVPVSTNQWYQIAAVFDYQDSTIGLYVNGAQVGSLYNATWGATAFTPESSVKRPVLGAQQGVDTAVTRFDGQIDEFALYNYELSSGQISSLYLSAVPEPTASVLSGLGVGILLLYTGTCRRVRSQTPD